MRLNCLSSTNPARNKTRDRSTYHGEPGENEFLADKIVGDSAMDGYAPEYGGGVMIVAEMFRPRIRPRPGE